jgi:hypothetical protein
VNRILPFLVGLALATGAGAVAFVLTSTLPRPALQVRLAAAAVGEVDPSAVVASSERIGDVRLRARCAPVGARSSLVVFGDGKRLHLAGAGRALIPRIVGPSRSLLETAAELAGCPRILGRLLARRVEQVFLHGGGRLIRYHRGRLGVPADYSIRLTARRPWIVLDLYRRTFEPYAVEVLGARPGGVSVIHEVELTQRMRLGASIAP